MNLRHFSFILSVVLFLSTSYSNASNLSTIKQELLTQEKESELQKKQRAKLINEIAQYDKKIAQLLTGLEKYQKQLIFLDKDISKLNQEINSLMEQKQIQTTLLAKQLRSIFKIGQSGILDLMFNPKKTFQNERITQYYRYLTRAREESITKLNQTNTLLNDKMKVLQDKRETQQEIIQKQKAEKITLETNQSSRTQKRIELDNDIEIKQQKIEQLKKEANALSKQIQLADKKNKLNQIKNKQENLITNGLGSPKNNLPFPVKGTIEHLFGEQINEQLLWKGLMIRAKEGTPVQSIEDGKVILANWLDGYGFIIVVDHGQGDMTLYGYNQRLAANLGDNIKKGDVIAYVGKTGTERDPALYFEIRRNGKAQNPLAWLKAN